MTSRNVSNTFTLAGRSVWLYKGDYRRTPVFAVDRRPDKKKKKENYRKKKFISLKTRAKREWAVTW